MSDVTTEPHTAKSFNAEAFAMNIAKAMETSGQALAAYLKPRDNGEPRDKPPNEIGEVIKTFSKVAQYLASEYDWFENQDALNANFSHFITTISAPGSSYPHDIDIHFMAELIRDAQRISRELGAIPSQNKLKAALHVRSERARAVLNALRETGFDPADTAGTRRLQVVPDGPADTTADGPDEPVAASVSAQVGEGTEPVPGVPEPLAWLRHGRSWPIALLAAPAFVAIWSGWVGLGGLTGFGLVHPLPGIADGLTLNSAITLPIGVETYAAYALRVWLAIGVASCIRHSSLV